MPITPANHAKVYLASRLPDGHAAVNVLWYTPNVSPDPEAGLAAAVALAGNIDSNIGTALKALQGADTEYIGTSVVLNTSGVTFTAFDNTNAGPGAAGGDSLPNNCAALIQKRTSTPGRSGRGRWYFGGIAEAVQEDSRLTVAAQGLLADLAVVLQSQRTGVSGIDWLPCHLREGNSLEPLLGCQPLVRLFSQRRRSFRNSF